MKLINHFATLLTALALAVTVGCAAQEDAPATDGGSAPDAAGAEEASSNVGAAGADVEETPDAGDGEAAPAEGEEASAESTESE